MTRHAALRAALEELTAALESPSLDEDVAWVDVRTTEDVDDTGEPDGDDAATRRAVLEELRGL